MPKITRHPRLRTVVRKGARGQRWVYYYYDMRPEGKKDISLGKNHGVALAKWAELFHKQPMLVGTIQEGITRWREQVLIGTTKSPSPYTNSETRIGYTKHLKRIELWCGSMAWEQMTFVLLKQYLSTRSGKVQANRELAIFQIVWNFSRGVGLTELHWPAAGLGRSKWKNAEYAREMEVTDEMFDSVHAQGDQVLRDAMDLASATGMRVTDVRTIPLPPGSMLHLRANKTKKKADFDINLSQVLPELFRRRRANRKAEHLMFLAGPFKRPVSYGMLRDRFTKARAAAAEKARHEGNVDLAEAISGMILRDCRKYAADQAGSLEEASKLLQHGNIATTRRHYRTKADKATPVR